jgi:hypothetical protein
MRLPTKLQVFCQFLTQKKISQLFSPPPPPRYSPDLSPPDYFLVPKLKMMLKGLHFADVAEIQETVTDKLKKVQKEFSAAFYKLYNPANACIYSSGAYFELKKVFFFLVFVFDLKKSDLKLFYRTV